MSIKEIMLFLLGAGVGSAATYFGMKKYFETLMDEEIESTKEYYKTKTEATTGMEQKTKILNEKYSDETEIEEKTDENEPDYAQIIEKMNYGEFFEKKTPAKIEEQPEEKVIPFVISGDAFAGDLRHEKVSLYYFEKDGVFMNVETDDVLPNGMELIGEENFEHLGEFEEDVLYVRNDEMGTDYEVMLEHYAYAESEYRDHQDEDE